MPDPTRFMTDVLAMWTETGPGLRLAAIEAHFLDDVRFHDPDGEFTGHDALERFSDSLQRRFPGARFTLAKPPQQLGDAIPAYWPFGPPDKPGAVSGMDFVILDGGKARTLYAFLDSV
jgi:SnoaL-like domain